MLLDKALSCLLLVDVQEKLAHMVHSSSEVIECCSLVLRLAKEIKIPIYACEQYPAGLGGTLLKLNPYLPSAPIAKTSFSCFQSQQLRDKMNKTGLKQVVLIGIETHVCVLQTALEMRRAGWEVFVVIDAVSSRSQQEHQAGLDRMLSNGVILLTAEMVFFEWVRDSSIPEFKALNQLFFAKK